MPQGRAALYPENDFGTGELREWYRMARMSPEWESNTGKIIRVIRCRLRYSNLFCK